MEDDLTSMLNNRLPNNGDKAKPTAITLVKETDVLCGRGGLALRHPGNQNYRKIIALNKVGSGLLLVFRMISPLNSKLNTATLNKQLYATCLKTDKLRISKSIVAAIREINGRFLEREDGKVSSSLNEKDEHGNLVTWRDIGNKRSIEKTSQALREGQPKLLKKLAESQGFFSNVDSMANNGNGVLPQPQSQAMPQIDRTPQKNINQQNNSIQEVQPIGPPGFACSSAFPSVNADNFDPSQCSMSAPKRLSCEDEDLMPLPFSYDKTGTEIGRDVFSTNEQQQLMSCLSICGEEGAQNFHEESVATAANKRPSVTWQLPRQSAPLRPSLFSLSMASHFSELSILCDDLSLDSAMDALKRESELDMIGNSEAVEMKPRRSILRNKSPVLNNSLDQHRVNPGIIFTSTLDTRPGGVNSGTDVSGFIEDSRKSIDAFEVGVDHRRSSRMSLCSALTDFSEAGIVDIDDSDDSF